MLTRLLIPQSHGSNWIWEECCKYNSLHSYVLPSHQYLTLKNWLLFPQFIESLSPDQKLDISKNSLESVTQKVVCYQVVNLTYQAWSILLVDTPGFLDTKLSESRITKMIVETLDSLQYVFNCSTTQLTMFLFSMVLLVSQSAASVAVFILYFQPITDIRMGGSKRDAVKLLRAFAESFRAIGITVVTTMWNHIPSSKKMEDANHRLSNLQNEIFVVGGLHFYNGKCDLFFQ